MPKRKQPTSMKTESVITRSRLVPLTNVSDMEALLRVEENIRKFERGDESALVC
jgi:hypothetical protein